MQAKPKQAYNVPVVKCYKEKNKSVQGREK